MDDINVTPVLAGSSTVENIPVRPQRPAKTAADWVRDMRMSPEVNKTTVGVETDRITPDLLMATSSKLLGISRREQDPDPKDSLLFQRFYGPAEYFAEHVLRDGGKVARNLLWKATNKGKIDFVPSGALDQHISDVFYTSKLAQMIDGSSPLETVDAAFKTTRVGEGGVADVQSAPDEMRTVQASYFGYLDPVRSAERKRVGLDMYMTKNVLKGSDGKLYQRFINARTGKEELVDSVTASKSIVAAPEMMDADTKSVFALGGRTGVRIVPKDQVDYYLPRADDAYSTASNLVAMPNGVKEMRLLMGCLHPGTPLVTISSKNEITITPAKSIGKNAYGVPGCDGTGKSTGYLIRNSIAKFPQKRKWFKKVVLLSGRSLITSYDHRWPVLRDNALVLVNADKLQPGDQVLRSTFKDLPNRRTFMRGVLVNKDVATLLGCIVRSVTQPEPGKLRVVYQPSQKTFIDAAIKRLKLEGSRFYANAGDKCLAIHDASFIQWVEKEICIEPEERRVPTVILSACLDIASHFIDAYTANPTQVGIDSNEDMWILDIPSMICRDGLALLLARMQTDTLYRDAVRSDGVNLALKLVEQAPTFGDSIVDEVKVILEVEKVPIMIDIDIDDNMYAAANGIITHNSKYPLQAISLLEREAPLVRNLDEATGKDMPTLVGKYLGARFAKQGGTVTAVRKDRIDVIYDDGTKGQVSLYQNFPMNAKGYITNTPVVKAGQSFKKGDILASSNYTDDKGVAAIGKNLRSGWLSWKGGTYEDAVVLSESAAKALTSRTMYKSAVDLDKTVSLGKKNYVSWKPSEYTKDQLEALDDNGIVKPGAVLRRGDPMILAVQTTEPSPGTLGKRVLTDISETWEHDHPGVVTDVVKTRKGVKVYATVEAPAEIGDKISGHYGNKGIVSCYDSSTYVFTDSGFKLFADLTKTDKVATLGKDGIARFEYPSRIVSQWYEGPMYKCKARRADWCVTPNHDMWCADRHSYERKKNPEYRRQNVADIAGRRTFHKVAAKFEDRRQVRDTFILPVENVKQQKDDAFVFSAVDFASLLGIWLAEGHVYAKYGTVIITQKEHDKDRNSASRCRKIEDLLTRMGLRWKRYGIKYEIRNRALFSYLRSLGRSATKYIPAAVFDSFPQDAQRALLDWHYMGDGDKTGTTKRAATVSRQLCMDLQRLHILLGDFCTTTDKDVEIDEKEAGIRISHRNYRRYRITHTDISDLQMHHRRISVTDYAGFVYCVTVSSGVVLTMRGGKPLWCGNSIGPESSSSEAVNDEEKEYSIQRIVPDAMMPLGEDGKPLDLLFSPLGLVSRTNASMIHEALLGKIARKTGKPYVIPAFYKGDLYDLVESQLKQHRISDTEDLTDPYTGKKIPKVLTGVSYIYKLKHQAESKLSARGTDSYTAEGQPGGGGFTGSKRYGTLETSALVGHQAFDTLLDAAMIRGQSNSDFWRSIRTGEIPTIPGEPLVHKKFFAHLTGSGVNVRKTPKGISVFSLSNDDVKELAGPRELKSKDTYEAKTFRPIDGGLFGQDLFGPNGDRWAYIQLDEPLPNPVMEEPLARLLRMSTKDFMAVAAGKAEVNGMKSSADIKERLSRINLEAEEKQAQKEFKDAPMSKKDAALKRYRDIARMKANEVPPDQYMLDRIPVLPPIYRPVSTHNGLTMVADSNYLYAQMMDARDDVREAKNLPAEYQQQARENLYRSWKELTGMYEPENVKLKNKHVQGLLKWALGNSPKCYDDETDILTRDGWVKFSEYNGDCEVATVNPVTDTFEWQQPLDVIHAKGPSEMVQIKTRVLDSLVTGNHEHYVSVRHRHNGVAGFDTYEKLRADYLCEHPNRMRQKTAASSYEGQKPVPPIPVEDLVAFSEFVGWYIADGWVHSNGNSVIVEVKEGTTKDHQLHDLFTRIGCEYKRLVCVRKTASTRENTKSLCDVPVGYATVRYAIYAKELKAWILANIGKGAKNKTISATVLSWSSVYLNALLKGLLLGDGSKRRHTDKSTEDKQTWHNRKDISDSGVALNTTSAALVDAVQELGAKIGIHMAVISAPYTRDRATPLYRISVHAFDYAMVEGGKQVYKTPYTGLVHCVTVPNGLIITRRNGKVLVSGNSSAFQRKVLGSTVDTVGRGVIAPDPRLKLNQLGVPVPMALGIFEPFVARAMVKQGYTPVEALKMIKARDKRVMPVLVDVMKHSPVQLNRAPSLHKLNIMGFEPVLVAGHAVKVNPSIVVPFAADFDGNCCDFDSVIFLKLSKSALEKTAFMSYIDHSNKPEQNKEVSMITEDTRVVVFNPDEEDPDTVYCSMKIGEFPRKGVPVKDRNGALVYPVPEGVSVLSCDPVTGAPKFCPVSAVTVEENCHTVELTMGSRKIIVSDNESLAAFDSKAGTLIKVSPAEIGDRMVPVLKKQQLPYGPFGTRDLGWMFGAFISDGWVTHNMVGYAKVEANKRAEFVRIMRAYHENFTCNEYADRPHAGKNKLGASVKLHLCSKSLADWMRNWQLVNEEWSEVARAALRKQINSKMIQYGSEDFLWGLFSGLLDGDGSISKNTTMEKPRFTARFSTSSKQLADDICALCYRLGLRYSMTVVPPRGFSNTAYIIIPSTIDLHAKLDKLTCIGEREIQLISEWKQQASYKDTKDMIPLSVKEAEVLIKLANARKDVGVSSGIYKTRKKACIYGGRIGLMRYCEDIKEMFPDLYARIKNEDTIWQTVTSVEDAGNRQVFDLMVEGTKVFAINNGVIIWDTANVHAPVSDNARRETYEKMFPERNLISMRNRQILYKPEKEYMQGLYVATRMKKGTGQRPRIFSSVEEARQALRKGIIDIDDPIEIRKQ